MRRLLIITVCKLNSERVSNQIENLKRNFVSLQKYNIQPLFVTADKDLIINDYKVLYLKNIEESYTNLAQKIVFGLKEIYETFSFDHIIKIDDDTLFNVDRLDAEVFNYDYIGHFFERFTNNKFIISFPSYNIEETINVYPSIFEKKEFSFAAGNFYILSKMAVQKVIYNIPVLLDMYKENVRISEDQFVGFCLQSKDITKLDYGFQNESTRNFVLQVTKNLTSIHPVSNNTYKALMTLAPEEQLQQILASSSLLRRKALLEQFKKNLIQVVFDFVNSKKISGMG